MNPELRSKLLLVGGVGLGFIVVDQITKEIAVRQFRPKKHPVIPNLFDLVYVENRGAAWGLLGDLDENVRVPLFIVVSILAVGMVAYLTFKANPSQRFLLVSLGMVFGGAVGNLIDRVRQAYVVDFLDFYCVRCPWPLKDGYHYPAFNVADIGISIGVVLLILDATLSDGLKARIARRARIVFRIKEEPSKAQKKKDRKRDEREKGMKG